ncbi:MAG: IclR family transcriptional regulator [Rubrivivax sp.]
MNNTLLKGLAVVELLARSEKPLSQAQIARELGIVRSNVHRLMQALEETRFVWRDEDSGTYSAAIKLWELGSAVLAKLDLRRHAQRQMEELMRSTGESVHLSVLDGVQVVYVHKVESLNPVRAYTQIGGRAEAFCVATGKIQLAFASPSLLTEVSDSLRPFTDRTITDPQAFLREMKRVRTAGYAINRGEWRDGVWGIAAPITDIRGTVIAALGISGPAERFRRRSIETWVPTVLASALDVSQALGGGRASGALTGLRFGST